MPSFKITGLSDFKKILNIFIIHGCGGHLGHLTLTIYLNFRSPFRWRLKMKFGFDWCSLISLKMVDDDKCQSMGIL